METDAMVELSREFAGIAAEIHNGDGGTVLRRVLDLAVKHVHGCTSASIAVINGAHFRTLLASDEVAERLDALQFEFDQGPAVQAARTEVTCLLFDVQTEPRWRRFVDGAATATAVRSALSLPLTGETSAALTCYGEAAAAFDDEAIDIATILAAHASTLLALSEASDHAANLETALQHSREIGAALGILMAHRKVTQDDAFAMLRRASQNLHRKLREVAAEVVETGTLPEVPAPAAADKSAQDGSAQHGSAVPQPSATP
ncbi:MAG: hypothetical protein JWN95_88 [Frankiales bacterium]|nr:hypothetical protein [Frankiales bacterium]